MYIRYFIFLLPWLCEEGQLSKQYSLPGSILMVKCLVSVFLQKSFSQPSGSILVHTVAMGFLRVPGYREFAPVVCRTRQQLLTWYAESSSCTQAISQAGLSWWVVKPRWFDNLQSEHQFGKKVKNFIILGSIFERFPSFSGMKPTARPTPHQDGWGGGSDGSHV